jgi:hypothetical protein
MAERKIRCQAKTPGRKFVSRTLNHSGKLLKFLSIVLQYAFRAFQTIVVPTAATPYFESFLTHRDPMFRTVLTVVRLESLIELSTNDK